MEFLWELYEAQAARGRHFVHELTSEVNSRMQCMAKIMAMPGTRKTVADLRMFGLAACDEGGPGFVNTSVRTVTNAKQVVMRMQSKCTDTHRHARVDASDTIEKGEETGTWVRQVARAMEEQLREAQQQLETGEQKKKAEDAKRILGLFTKMRRTKERVTCKMKWENQCITKSRTCSACGKGGIGMTRKAGGLIQSCAPRQDVKQWSTFIPT